MDDQNNEHPPLMSTKDIERILPHRYPFLLVDRVLRIDLQASEIVAVKNVTSNEPFFQGHFPGAPIMPGVLLLEALAQAGGILVHQKGYDKKIAVLLNITKAKFRRPVVPGDVLYLEVKGLHISGMGGKINGKAKVQDQLAAEAELSFALVDKGQL